MKLVVQIDDMMRKNGLSLSSIDSKDAVDEKPASFVSKKWRQNFGNGIFVHESPRLI